jgi:membrane protease YdiL (CAAX protease family)
VNAQSVLEIPRKKSLLILVAWVSMLLISDLPNILLTWILGQEPEWLIFVKVGVLGILLGICLIWKAIKPLWQYALVMLVLFIASGSSARLGNTSWWQNLFGGSQESFTMGYLGIYIRDLGMAFAVVATLWILKRRRKAFYLVKGQIDAPFEPVRWLGIREGGSWRTLGWIFVLVVCIATLIPTVFSLQLSSNTLLRAGYLLPSILLFSAINAFTEEIYFRLSLLSTLYDVIGRTHTLLIIVVFFGLAHYMHGSPSGIIGFLMTGFLAWLLAKSILETKGIFWAWFIHFLADVVVFAYYAIDWVQN